MTVHHDTGEPIGNGCGYEIDTCELTASEVVVRTRHGRAGNAAPVTIRRHEVNLFPEGRQFLIYASFDGSWDLPDDQENGDGEGSEAHIDDLLLGFSQHTIRLGTVAHETVAVTVEVRDRPPGEEDLWAWDHVAEVDLSLPTGLLGVGSTNASLPEPIPVAPCLHRVRLYFGNLDATGNVGGPAPDLAGHRYRATLWPISEGEEGDPVVLKRWPKVDSHPALLVEGGGKAPTSTKSPSASQDA